MKKILIILILGLLGLTAFSQSPIPSGDGYYFTSKYLLDTNSQGERDTIILHIFYEDIDIGINGVGSLFNVYRIKRGVSGEWDTIKRSMDGGLPKDNPKYSGLHSYFATAQTKDTVDKYFEIWLQEERPYLDLY